MSEPIRLVYLGKLADIAGREGNRLDVHAGPIDWAYLLSVLEKIAPGLSEAVAHEGVKVAVNGQVLRDKTLLNASAGDEVAFLPPVSGG